MLKALNLALRFLLEICALMALAYAGLHATTAPIRVVLGVALPAIAAVLWAMFVAPKSAVRAPNAVRYGAEALVFAGAVFGLSWVGRTAWAAALACVTVLNVVLLAAWGQRSPNGSVGGAPPGR